MSLGDGNAFTCWCCQRECYGERIASGDVLICGGCDRLEPCPVVLKDLAPAPSVSDEQTSPATPLAVETKPPADATESGGGACAPTVERLLELAAEARRIGLELEGWAARARAAAGGER